MNKKKKKELEDALCENFFKILFFYLFFMGLSVVFDNKAAESFFSICLWWTFLVFVIAVVAVKLTDRKNSKMKTVRRKYRKDIEEDRCRELSRTVLYDYDILYLKKDDEIYTYQDRPIEVIIKEVKQD